MCRHEGRSTGAEGPHDNAVVLSGPVTTESGKGGPHDSKGKRGLRQVHELGGA